MWAFFWFTHNNSLNHVFKILQACLKKMDIACDKRRPNLIFLILTTSHVYFSNAYFGNLMMPGTQIFAPEIVYFLSFYF